MTGAAFACVADDAPADDAAAETLPGGVAAGVVAPAMGSVAAVPAEPLAVAVAVAVVAAGVTDDGTTDGGGLLAFCRKKLWKTGEQHTCSSLASCGRKVTTKRARRRKHGFTARGGTRRPPGTQSQRQTASLIAPEGREAEAEAVSRARARCGESHASNPLQEGAAADLQDIPSQRSPLCWMLGRTRWHTCNLGGKEVLKGSELRVPSVDSPRVRAQADVYSKHLHHEAQPNPTQRAMDTQQRRLEGCARSGKQSTVRLKQNPEQVNCGMSDCQPRALFCPFHAAKPGRSRFCTQIKRRCGGFGARHGTLSRPMPAGDAKSDRQRSFTCGWRVCGAAIHAGVRLRAFRA
jgi:hypothetical protein